MMNRNRVNRKLAVAAAPGLAVVLVSLLAGCSAVMTAPPVVTIVALTESAVVGAPIQFEVRLDPAPATDVTVNVAVDLDPAGCTLARPLPSTVTIAAGSETATLTVSTTGAEVGADGCTVTVTAVSGEGYQVGEAADTSASATLAASTGSGEQPDPADPVVTIAADSTSVVEGGRVSFTLTARPPPASPLTVTLAWSQSGSFLDGTGPSTVIIASGSETATVSAATENDSTDEPNGSVTVSVEAGSGYTPGTPRSATIGVTDNDNATRLVGLQSVTPDPVMEGAQISITFTINPQFTSPIGSDRFFRFRIDDSAGSAQSATRVTAAGTATTHTAPFDTIDTNQVEPDRTIVVSVLSSLDPDPTYAVGSPASMTIDVRDAN